MFRMSLYAHPNVRNSGSYFGYAYTYQEIAEHLRKYKHEGNKLSLDINSPKSKIQMYYGSPDGFFYDHQYKIQMTQWESTMVPPHWVDFAKRYDEWWTANQFGADAFIRSGVPAEKIHIYEHGVDSNIWTPKKRGKKKKIRFLHIDSGSPRKRADLAIKAFKIAFGNNTDYELTLKYSHHHGTTQNWSSKKVLENHGEWEDGNIRHIRENLSLNDLVNLFHFHDVLVYPSEGEGFGLIPLQALATGMPVISTSDWCSYDKYFKDNIIESRRGVSEVVETYTRYGEVIIPSLDSLVYQMKQSAENIEEQSNKFYKQSSAVAEDYSWQKRTNLAIDSLIDRVGIHMFENSNYSSDVDIKPFKSYKTEKQKILIYTLFRNSGKFIDMYYSQIKYIVDSFPHIEFYFSGYENDSTDDTKEKLSSKDWSIFKDHSLILEDIGTRSFGSVVSGERVKNLSEARNKAIEAKDFLDKVDYVMMIESDVKYKIEDVEKIINFGKKENFDIVSGITYGYDGNEIVLYDSWATRRRSSLEYNAVNNKKPWPDIDPDWTNISYERYLSTSNGICLYKAKPFVEGVRHGYISSSTNDIDCEMVVLCENFIKNGYSNIFILHDARIGHIGHGEKV